VKSDKLHPPCPSQKLIRGKYAIIHHFLCSDWMQLSGSRSIWNRRF